MRPLKSLIIIVRADPIVCGHSTEARNLAEAAIASGVEHVHIVTWPMQTLENSGLPLKPPASVLPYSDGIVVERPKPVGDYKVLDGRLLHGMAGRVCDLLHQYARPDRGGGRTAIMDLYLVPHGEVTIRAAESFRVAHVEADLTTIAEAVGSDITNVVNNAVEQGRFGAAQLVLTNFLQHDLPVAVSDYTRRLIVEAGRQVDSQLGTNFGERLDERTGVSYPAIDTQAYTKLAEHPDLVRDVLQRRGLDHGGYLLFLSRVVPAKGVDDLIDAYRASDIYHKKTLVIAGTGPAQQAMVDKAGGDPRIRFFTDVSDAEKGSLMHACGGYVFPSKPRPEFTETFGIAVAEKMLAGGPGPVITTRTGGIPEATGGFCLEHEAGNVQHLTAQLDRLAEMSDAEMQQLNQAAQDYALRFDGKVILRTLTEKLAAVTG